MLDLIRKALGRTSHPLNKIEISKEALISNYRYLSKVNHKVKIAPVLKSNAYGHGINLAGPVLDKLKPPFFAVDSLYEANLLRKSEIKSKILIMGYIDPQNLKVKKLPYAYAAWGIEFVQEIDRYQKGAQIHIFVDSGMHREGVQMHCKDKSETCTVGANNCLVHFLEELKKFKHIEVSGIMTHLAIGAQPAHLITKQQIATFKKAVEVIHKQAFPIRWVHIGGTNAILHNKNLGVNVVRSGLATYGYDPIFEDKNLKPALKLTSKIAQIKIIPKGSGVGYDATFIASKETRIGILPIGYFDGVDRRLSNKGVVMIAGKPCKMLGYASMNMTTVDLTPVSEAKVGDEVLVFSDYKNDPNSFPNAAKTAGTTVYDLLVHLNPTTKRILD